MIAVLPAMTAAHVAAGTIDVINFDTATATAQGGQYGLFGALPDQLQDRLATLGEPAGGAWRIEVLAGAASKGLGGVIPLFDTTLRAEDIPLLDVSSSPVLEIALTGKLDARRVLVELLGGRVLDAETPGVGVGTIEATQVDAQRWSTLRWSVPADGIDRTKVGAVRLMFEGEGPAWIALASVRFVADGDAAPATLPPPAPQPPIRQAMWVWRTTKILPDPAKVDQLFAFCKAHDITDLFWQVPYNKYKDRQMVLLLVDEQRAFNVRAAAAGIRIHALDGGPEFVLRENHERVFKLVEALDAFNREGPKEGRYAAVHMDNEPYVLKGWKASDEERQEIIQQYIELNRALRKQVNEAGMEYGVDIPFWWDKEETPGKRAYNVHTDKGDVPLLDETFALVQNAGIMSYRVRALGRNGVIDCCRTEFDLGKRLGVDVFASVELGQGERVEKGITYGVYPVEYFLTQLDTLRRALSHQPGCAGIAIHAYYSFEEMLEKRP